MPSVGVEHRRLPDGRPGASHQRIEKQARFVDQDEVRVCVASFF